MKKITIIGSGYVGLVSGAGLASFGHKVICVDIDTVKIDKLNLGEIPIFEPGLKSLILENVKKDRLFFNDNIITSIKNSDVIIIAVGTPQGKNGEADLSAVYDVAKLIGNNLNSYKVISTKSTVPVGTGEKIEQIIKSNKNKNNFDYVSNPEFLREGSSISDFMRPDRIIIGTNSKKAFETMKDIYRPLYINKTPIIMTTVKTAEMIKYASNAFLALKISYINEIANLCESVGANIQEVSNAMGMDGRISSKFLHAGPGFGGSCFPKDTEALVQIGKKHNTSLSIIEAAIKSNSNQIVRMRNKLFKLLSNKVKGTSISILGLSFKPNTDDIRGAPACYFVSELLSYGAKIKAYDPIAITNFKKKFTEPIYCTTWQEAVKDTDACIILTELNEFRGIDLFELKKLMKNPVLLDVKNILNVKLLEKLNFVYDNVGKKLNI